MWTKWSRWPNRAPEHLAAPGLNPRRRRKVAVLACMDTRIDLLPMFGLDRGNAHIIRNAGGLVTEDVIRSSSDARIAGHRRHRRTPRRSGVSGRVDDDLAVGERVPGTRKLPHGRHVKGTAR
jgi:hypothetical protein